MIYFVNCNWVATRWQQYSTHLHTNSTQNDTILLGRVRAVHCLCELYRGIWLTTEGKARKSLSQGSRRVPVGTMRTEYTEQVKVKVKVIPQHAEVTQRVPGRLRSRIFSTFGTTSVVGCQPYAPAVFTPGEIPGNHFQGLSRPQGT